MFMAQKSLPQNCSHDFRGEIQMNDYPYRSSKFCDLENSLIQI